MKNNNLNNEINRSDRNDILKIIAIITMLIDHIGAILFPKIIIFRIIGRISFPIICYLLTLGYKKTSNINKYFMRLIIAAIISHIPYVLAFKFPSYKLNVLFLLVLGLMLLNSFKKGDYVIAFIIFLMVVFLESLELKISYGSYGLILIGIFYYLNNKRLLILSFLILNIIYITFLNMSLIQIYSILSLIFIKEYKHKIMLNKYFFYIFYPLHLLLLHSLKLLIT